MRRIVASPSMPGGTRQSTSSSALAGITLIFSDAKMRVGTAVTRSVGSTIVASRGSTALMLAIARGGIAGVLAERLEQRAAAPRRRRSRAAARRAA